MANNRRSRLITQGIARSPNRAMLRAVGFGDADFDKPIAGVASLHSDITPCNAHLDRLVRKGVEGVRAAGGVPQVFGAPTYVYDKELFWGQDRLDFLDRALTSPPPSP